jgi:hypothetical protein
MSITRPPAMTDEEADERRARGGRVYQTSQDPRLSYLLNWFLSIVAVMLTAGGIGAFTMLISMRDDVRDMKNRPAPATADQVAYLQKQINEIRDDITEERERARR